MAVVGKRRWRALLILRRLLICAIGIIALMALLSIHVPEILRLPADTSYKLPTVCYCCFHTFFFLFSFSWFFFFILLVFLKIDIDLFFFMVPNTGLRCLVFFFDDLLHIYILFIPGCIDGLT